MPEGLLSPRGGPLLTAAQSAMASSIKSIKEHGGGFGHHCPSDEEKAKMRSFNSMSFLPADNKRHEARGARGLRAMPTCNRR